MQPYPKQQQYHVGQNLDVLDSVNQWMNAEVRFVGNGTIYIHYTGWTYKYDESIPIGSSRILKQWRPGQQIYVNNRIDAYHPIGGWLQARVIQKYQDNQQSYQKHQTQLRNKVKVHFFNYHKKYDIWVDLTNTNEVSIIGSKSKAYGMGKNRKKQAQLSQLLRKLLQQKRKILHQKLAQKNFIIKQSGGDGNCLFRSISDQLYGSEEHYVEIRKFCMDYIEFQRNFFQDYIADEDIDQYIQRKRRDGEWGDDVEIQALSEIYCRPIQIFVFDDVPIRTFHEDNENNIEPLRLNYMGGCHYNSIKYKDKIDEGLLQTKIGQLQSVFFTSYKSTPNMQEIQRNRNLFSTCNRIENTIEQRLQAEQRQQTKIQDQLTKILEISETEAILEQIENAELKEFQLKYEQEKLQEELKKLEEKEIQEAKKISQGIQQGVAQEGEGRFQSEKPYWFEELKGQGFSDKEIWFAIDVKGYDPDAVQNFLLDNLYM